MATIVLDTNIFLAALLKADTTPRQIVRSCLQQEHFPLMGNALLAEYEDVLSREELFERCPLTTYERESLLDAFLSCCRWISIYYLWRPNLRDEADNHIVELALAGNADSIITRNKKDFKNSQLLFPELSIVDPNEFFNMR